MTTDFRTLCAELVGDVEEWMAGTDHTPPSSVELVQRARAALTQPEPQEPTDGEIDQLWDDTGEYFALYPEVRKTIRAALLRWGR